MVFLGTPFHGSPVAPLAEVFSSMVSVLHRTHTQKVKDLKQKSEKLQILGESFATVLHQRIRNNKEIQVAFFHETKRLHGLLVSVQRESDPHTLDPSAPSRTPPQSILLFSQPVTLAF
jgi:hypothetical protein